MAAMSREFLIDGYNLLMQWSGARLAAGPGNLERARTALIRAIGASAGEAVTIVFDAHRPSKTGVERWHGNVRILFSAGYPDADTLIAELIRAHSHPKDLWVVSDDRAVQRQARRRRARVVPCADFESLLERPPVEATGVIEKPTVPADSAEWRETFAELEAPPATFEEEFRRDMSGPLTSEDGRDVRKRKNRP